MMLGTLKGCATMFSGYSFRKYINANDEKILGFLYRTLSIASNGYNDTYVKFASEPTLRDIHIDFYCERKDNIILVRGKDYTTKHGAPQPEAGETPIWIEQIKFIVEREDDNISLVTGYYEENPRYNDITLFVAQKFWSIIVNLGERFAQTWCDEAKRNYQEVQSQLEKARGGHEGLTEWHRDPSGIMMRSYGFIPNGVHATTNSDGEVAFTDEKPRKREEFLDNVVVGNVLDVIADQLNNGRNSHAYQLDSGAIANWDLEVRDMRPQQNEIVVNARYWLERPGGVSDLPANLSGVMKFSGLQLTGSEKESGRAKLIGEISNESVFIRGRFDGVWADTLQVFKAEEESTTKHKETPSNITNVSISDVIGSNIVIGNGNNLTITNNKFEPIYCAIEDSLRSATAKKALSRRIDEIRNEIAKGEQANESFLTHRLRNLKKSAPDIAEVALSALAGPGPVISTIVKKVAQRIKDEASNK